MLEWKLLNEAVQTEKAHELARHLIANDAHKAHLEIQNGANVNFQLKGDSMRTPFHYAVMHSQTAVVRWLLRDHAADMSLKSDEGKSILEIAERCASEETISFLRSWPREVAMRQRAQEVAKFEQERQAIDNAKLENLSRDALAFLDDIPGRPLKERIHCEADLIAAFKALCDFPFGVRQDMQESARLVKSAVGDAWSDVVWKLYQKALRSYVTKARKEKQKQRQKEREQRRYRRNGFVLPKHHFS